MKVASDAIYAKVDSITAAGLARSAVSELMTMSMDKLYSKTVDKLGNDYDELKLRAEASSAIKKLSCKSNLTDLDREQLVTLQTQLTNPENKYPLILETVNPSRNGSMKVLYCTRVLIPLSTKLLACWTQKAFKVLRLKSGSACYLIWSKYEDYMSGLTIKKQANMFKFRWTLRVSGQ